MSDSNARVAHILELLMNNQDAIAAGLEAVALWIEAKGSPSVHENIMAVLETLEYNADAVNAAISSLAGTDTP